jgi:hypothetical protein
MLPTKLKRCGGRSLVPHLVAGSHRGIVVRSDSMGTSKLGRWFIGVTAAMVASAATLLALAGAVAQADGSTPQVPTEAQATSQVGVPPAQEVTATPEAGSLTDQELAEYRATHDTDPHIPLTAEQQAILAKKQQMARDFYFAKYGGPPSASEGSAAGSPSCPDFDGDGTVRVSDIRYVVNSYFSEADWVADLDGTGKVLVSDILIVVNKYFTNCQRAGLTNIGRIYQGQINSYYCGPAAVSEALRIKGILISQSAVGTLLTTDDSGGQGTPFSGWYGSPGVPAEYDTGHPVPDVLNYKTAGANNYVPVGVPGSPSSADTANYIFGMVSDINQHWPVIGNGWEVAGGSHLRGHPNQEIFHWITISGYEDAGTGTNYMDSAITVWPAVEGWNTLFPSDTLVIILGGRGYVW